MSTLTLQLTNVYWIAVPPSDGARGDADRCLRLSLRVKIDIFTHLSRASGRVPCLREIGGGQETRL